MSSADGDFRDFVAEIAGPLTRLAGLLIANSPNDRATVGAAERLAVRALARTKRDWRDSASAPEQASVAALLSRLPKERRSDESPTVDFPDDDDEARNVKAAIWRSWCTLDLRHRAPLAFGSPSVVSRWFDDVEVPRSFASRRKLDQLSKESDARLRLALAHEDAIGGDVDDAMNVWLRPTLRDVASRFETPADAWSRVDAAAGRLRWRAGAAAAAIVVVVAGGSAMAANASQPKRPVATTASPSTSVEARALQPPGLTAGRVVDWPTRGNLNNDSQLLAQLRTDFVAAHPDALGQVQVLLAADTAWFRLAYVTSPSPDGAIGSWFYGPAGAQVLTEGAFRHGADVSEDGVVAAAVSDPSGHTLLVVIGPTDTTEVQWANVESFSAPDPPRGVDDLRVQNGIVVYDVSSTYLPAVRLVVHVGSAEPWSGAVPEVQLTTGSTALIPVERGFADATVLGSAMATARLWQRTGLFGSSADPKVVWGGADELQDVGVVVRMASPQLSDLVIVGWLSGHQRQPQTRAYRIDAASSDTPFAFFYTARDGTRVGVLAPHGAARAALIVDGVAGAPVSVDGSGFASMPVRGQTGLLAEQTVQVQFFEAAGKPISPPVIPSQPMVGGGGG